MKFTPKSEREIMEENLLQPGVYDFEVATAADRVSKSGNEMIHLKLHILDEDGNGRFVDDYLLESMPLKLRRAAEACGLLERYEAGELHAFDFEGATGQVKLKIQKGQKRDDGDVFPDKNSVADYLTGQKAAPSAKKLILDDEIPF